MFVLKMDLRLKNDAVIQIVGPSGCGKTLFVSKLLGIPCFKKPIKHIYWMHGVSKEHGSTAQYLSKLKKLTFLNGFEEGWIDRPKEGDVLVIDDLFAEANKEKDFTNLFTKVARHRGVTVIFITQNMFHQGGSHRTRNLNVHYLVIFKNPRDNTTIDHVARQAFPNNRRFLIEAFHDATNNTPFGYLFIDFTQMCPDDLRVRTNIFDTMYVYKQVER